MKTKSYQFFIKYRWDSDFDFILLPTFLIGKRIKKIGIGFLFLKLKVEFILWYKTKNNDSKKRTKRNNNFNAGTGVDKKARTEIKGIGRGNSKI